MLQSVRVFAFEDAMPAKLPLGELVSTISDSKKFIFIHIPKTGGTSITSAIRQYTNESEMIHKIHGPNIQISHWHSKFKQIKKPFDYYTFAAVRNPWDRIISMIYYKSRNSKDSEGCWESKQGQDLFKEMLNQGRKPAGVSPQYKSQVWYLNREVSRVMRFDNLQKDFDLVCDEIGIPQVELPMLNVSKHKHYRDLYTDQQRRWVDVACAEEIERFGFKF
jgi:hypothetical protein